MIDKWESQEQRLLRFMRIPPKSKLEWICQMHDFLSKAFTKEKMHIYYKLRGIR